MKESHQQLETSTILFTKFRSNTNEGSVLSKNEKLQLDVSFTQGNLGKNDKIQIQRIKVNSYKCNYFKKKNIRNIVQNQQ